MSVAHQPHPNTNRVISPERNSAESESTPPENGFTKKQKQIMAGIALVAVLVGGGIAELFGKSEAAPSPAHPNVAVSDTVNPGETQKAPAIPNEAKKFVSEVGNRYADPVSTYYAAEAYKKENAGRSPVLTDEFINNYSFPNQQPDVSPLGFTNYWMPIDTRVDEDMMVKIFNDYIKNNFQLYLQYMSMNSSPKARAIIDKEFLTYCSDTAFESTGSAIDNNPAMLAFTEDNDGITRMMELSKKIASEYGDTVNYKVALASKDGKDPNVTKFPEGGQPIAGSIKWNDQIVKGFAQTADLVINIDKYNGKDVSHLRKTKSVSFNLWEQPVTGRSKSTFVSIGLVEPN